MKNVWKGLVAVMLCVFVNTWADAQDKDKNRDKDKDKDKYRSTDKSDMDMSERLSRDLASRNPVAKDAIIVWDNTDDGYEGTYSVNDVNYLSRYDADGNYVETLMERDWDDNDNVPTNVRRGYNNSQYKSNKVEHFWEVKEPNRQGYYLEFKDNDGKSRRVWSDRDGKFSDSNPRKRDH